MPSVCSGQTIFMGVPLSMPAMMAVMEAMPISRCFWAKSVAVSEPLLATTRSRMAMGLPSLMSCRSFAFHKRFQIDAQISEGLTA